MTLTYRQTGTGYQVDDIPPAVSSGNDPTVIVDFGDSWGALAESSTAGYETSFSPLRQLNCLAGKPFRTVVKAGIDGNTTNQMIARFNTDVLATRAGWVKIPAGTVNDPANGIDYQTAISNVRDMCRRADDAGMKVILQTCPPNGNITNASYPERRRYQSLVNSWARQEAAAQGYILWDIEKANQDPTTGNFITNHSFDAVHESTLGSLRAAKLGMADFGALLPKIAPLGNNPLDPYNLVGFIGMPQGNNASGTGGTRLETGCSGTGPNGWAARRAPGASAGAAVCSTVNRPSDFPAGSAARLVYTAGADDYNGAWWMVGGNSLQADHGHWNKTWATRGAGATITYKDKVKPSVANGFIYMPVAFSGGAVSGTTGATEPTWPTEEGGWVVDNQVTWMAYRIPVAGEELYAEMEIETSSLTGNVGVQLALTHQTAEAGNAITETYDNFHVADNSRGQYEDVAAGRMVLRTKAPLIVPDNNPLLIYAQARVISRSSGVLTLDVIRVKIGNKTREQDLFF